MRPASRLLFSAAPPIIAALVGARAARNAPQVYRRLDKPSWAPPAGVFGPVWSGLYLLIGVAGWRETRRPNRAAMAWRLAQMGLNASWTPMFFGAGRRRPALAIAVGLSAAVAAEMAATAREGDRIATASLAPYLAWSGFAAALTASVSDPPQTSPAGPSRAA